MLRQQLALTVSYSCVVAVMATTCRWCDSLEFFLRTLFPERISYAQADVFGLARHRDGRWEWAAAPVVAPTPRYQVRATRVVVL